MTINLHDPRLTAYALGELQGEELAEIEEALARSEPLRQEVEAIRRAAEDVREALELEEAFARPQAPTESSAPAVTHSNRPGGIWLPAAALATAAAVVLALALTALPPVEAPPPPEVGELSPPPPSPVPDSEAAPPAPAATKASAEPRRAESAPAAGPKRAIASASQPSEPPSPAEQVRVRGTVLDLSGAVVPGAEVAVSGLAENQPRTVITDEQGRFSFDLKTPGKTSLTASLEVFKTYSTQCEATGRDKVINPVLSIGSVSEEISVIGSAPPTSVEMAVVGNGEGVGAGSFAAFPVRAAPVPDRELVSAEDYNTEAYDRIVEGDVKRVADNPLSTFSIDVDTASYSNVRRFLMGGALPPPDSVRIEELINYFPYEDPPPTGGDPFSVNVEVAEAPWNPKRLLLRIGLKGKAVPVRQRPAANLVFLLDVSGSMSSSNKLPLLKEALRLLVERLQPSDRVSIVVYAGASGLVLPSTPGNAKAKILAAIDALESGGSTNGGEGIELAYQTAERNFVRDGINRVILATDGDFNVGVTSHGDLTRLIEEKAKSGVFLTVLGFGMGNYKDSTLEKLADRGNGNYGYIDTILEARKLLVEQMDGTLITIAKDVKIQVEFNPAHVSAYRLIGYENRRLAAQDFNDDRKDAGEIGAGHSVTALYELIPVGAEADAPQVDPLKYQRPAQPAPGRHAHELLTVKLRYKEPDGEVSRLIEKAVTDPGTSLAGTSDDFRFAAAVAAFGMILRESEHRGSATYDMVLGLARRALGPDPYGYRSEFVSLVEIARGADGR